MSKLNQKLNSLVIFRDILKDKTISKLINLLKTKSNPETLTNNIAIFEAELFKYTTNWTQYLLKVILESENLYIKNLISNNKNKMLEITMKKELIFLQELSTLTLEKYLNENHKDLEIQSFNFLPKWEVEEIDLSNLYLERLSEINKKGYGIFAKYSVFTIKNSEITPVKYPDNQRLSDLSGYELERKSIIDNTKALLLNQPANNALLYGDAGTGKSSTIKAIVNEFSKDGLRLIEVKKNQLYQIPDIIEQLTENPLKFILFIDDLSFTSNDDNFSALKAILEGSVCRRSSNVIIYATSNRRHLIRENWSDREGNDVHANDTRQELMSLSDRFGLSVTFQKPGKDKYASIVTALAEKYNISDTSEEVIKKAEIFALRVGGRSPRAAKQFIELYKSGIE